jgi:hypothetical protein
VALDGLERVEDAVRSLPQDVATTSSGRPPVVAGALVTRSWYHASGSAGRWTT